MNRGDRRGTISICVSCVPETKSFLIENNGSVLRQMDQKKNKEWERRLQNACLSNVIKGQNNSEGFRHGYQKRCTFVSITNITAKILAIFYNLCQVIRAATSDSHCPPSTGANAEFDALL